MSPVILKTKNLRMVIFPKDHKPAHVHVYGPDQEAKFEINTMACIYAVGFSLKELKRIRDFMLDKQEFLIEGWNDWQE